MIAALRDGDYEKAADEMMDYQQKMRGRGFVVELKKTIRMD
jgi:hypothetical protein